jgi:hypothetical protein
MINEKALYPTSYKFYWGGVADFKVVASIIALNVPTRNRFNSPTKLICVVVRHAKKR